MKRSEKAALGEYLSFYPVDMTFDRIIELLESEGEGLTDEEFDDEYQEIGVWEPFEHKEGKEVARLLQNFADNHRELDIADEMAKALWSIAGKVQAKEIPTFNALYNVDLMTLLDRMSEAGFKPTQETK